MCRVQILLIVASIVAVMVYRLAVFFAFSTSLRQQDLKTLEPLKEYVTPQMATSVTASLINFVIIMILNTLYERVAIWITNFGECWSRSSPVAAATCLTLVCPTRHNRAATDQDWLREQLDPEDVPFPVCQLLLLLFLHRLRERESRGLSWKPRLSGTIPERGGARFVRVAVRFHLSCLPLTVGCELFVQCDPGGCLIELTTQLAVIMGGKAIWNNIQEVLLP